MDSLLLEISQDEIMENLKSELDLGAFFNNLQLAKSKQTFRNLVAVALALYKQPKLKPALRAIEAIAEFVDKPYLVNAINTKVDFIDKVVEIVQTDITLPLNQRGSSLFSPADGNYRLLKNKFYLMNYELICYMGQKYQITAQRPGEEKKPTHLAERLQTLSSRGVEVLTTFKYFPALKINQIKPEQQQMSPQDALIKYNELQSKLLDLAQDLETTLKGENSPTEIIQDLMDGNRQQLEELLASIEELLGSHSPDLKEGQQKRLNSGKKLAETFLKQLQVLKQAGYGQEAYEDFQSDVTEATKEFTMNKPIPRKKRQTPSEQTANPIANKMAESVELRQPTREPQTYQPPHQQPSRNQYQQQTANQQRQQVKPPSQNPYQSLYQQPPPQIKAPQQQQQSQPPPQTRVPQQQQQTMRQPRQNYAAYPPIVEEYEHRRGVSPIRNQLAAKSQFDEDFDDKSSYKSHIRERINLANINRRYEGEFIPYDGSRFELLNDLQLTNRQINRLKRCNLLPRALIISSPKLQIGCTTNLAYNDITNRYYLRICLFYGNKSDLEQDFSDTMQADIKQEFEGDSSIALWLRDPIIRKSGKPQIVNGLPYLLPGQQLEQRVSIAYNMVPYELITCNYSFAQSQQNCHLRFVLPCFLTKFMVIRDVDERIFNFRWEQKKRFIMKSETVIIDSNIVKDGQQMNILYFENKLLTLFDPDEYIQRLQTNEPINQEFGLVFTLACPNIEFMLKIILHPSNEIMFQIIPQSAYITQAEQLLHTLVFLLGKPD